jgi:hypothetical protein
MPQQKTFELPLSSGLPVGTPDCRLLFPLNSRACTPLSTSGECGSSSAFKMVGSRAHVTLFLAMKPATNKSEQTTPTIVNTTGLANHDAKDLVSLSESTSTVRCGRMVMSAQLVQISV